MAIPETQLETWSHQGSITQSAITYGAVKQALEKSVHDYTGKLCEVFLQGSYGNNTNIFSESDVDIVILRKSSFGYDIANLPEPQRQLFDVALSDSHDPSYWDYKNEVEGALKTVFGQSAKPDNKVIRVAGNGTRRDADVLAACAHRRYYQFEGISNQRYDEGLYFFTSSGARIINYPKQHADNCTLKHRDTGQKFKPMVRIFKNMRGEMIERGVIAEDTAPSYFIEGLLFNVPSEKFAGNYEDAIVESINWLFKADRTKFVCPSKQYYLLWEASQVAWSPAQCQSFLDGLVRLWNEW